MPTERLKNYLDENGARYESISHPSTYTAQRTAESLHVPGREMAKTTVIKADGAMLLAVLPGPMHVSLEQFRQVSGRQKVELATEQEFQTLFPGCDVGAMPPFGNLYGLDVWVEERLAEDESIVFNAGTHTEAVRMGFADFARLVKPRRARFAL
jgi:Ala-tRNA(Pro) deacylase